MGKPRPTKLAMGAFENKSKEIKCLSCNKLFTSVNPKSIRVCSCCKRKDQRKQIQSEEVNKEKRTKARTGVQDTDRFRRSKSKY